MVRLLHSPRWLWPPKNKPDPPGPTPPPRHPSQRPHAPPPPPLGQAPHPENRAHGRPAPSHNALGVSADTEPRAEQMAKKTPTLSLWPRPSSPSAPLPPPASPSPSAWSSAADPGGRGRPCRDPGRDRPWGAGGARNGGAVPLRPGAEVDQSPLPPRAATMSGRLTAGAATAPAPTESRTRGRKVRPGTGDRSTDGGVHKEEAGEKEDGGPWCITSSSSDDGSTPSKDTDGALRSCRPSREEGTGMGIGGELERGGDAMKAARWKDWDGGGAA